VGRSGVLGAGTEGVLSRLAFFVAAPALLFLTLAEADTHALLSSALVATAGSAVLSALLFSLLAWWRWRPGPAQLTSGALATSYVNAGNLGIPVASYVLGDAAFVAPTLLFQMLVFQPIALGFLDADKHGGRSSVWKLLSRPFVNPLTVGSLFGLALSLTGWTLPTMVAAPLGLLGDMAVPSMLVAYGIALRLGPGLGRAGSVAELVTTSTLKLLVQPAVAWFVASVVLGVDGHALLAIVVTSALPTAQNIFVHATRYDRATTLARDTILITTVGAVPVILLVAALLG